MQVTLDAWIGVAEGLEITPVGGVLRRYRHGGSERTPGSRSGGARWGGVKTPSERHAALIRVAQGASDDRLREETGRKMARWLGRDGPDRPRKRVEAEAAQGR